MPGYGFKRRKSAETLLCITMCRYLVAGVEKMLLFSKKNGESLSLDLMEILIENPDISQPCRIMALPKMVQFSPTISHDWILSIFRSSGASEHGWSSYWEFLLGIGYSTAGPLTCKFSFSFLGLKIHGVSWLYRQPQESSRCRNYSVNE